VLSHQSAATANHLVELVREAFASGLTWSFRLVAALAFAGVVVSVLAVGGSLRDRASKPRERQQ